MRKLLIALVAALLVIALLAAPVMAAELDTPIGTPASGKVVPAASQAVEHSPVLTE